MECRKRETFSYPFGVNVEGPDVADAVTLLSWSCLATRIRRDNGSRITVVDILDVLPPDLLSIFFLGKSGHRGRHCLLLIEQPSLFSPLARTVRGLLLVRCLIPDTEANTSTEAHRIRAAPPLNSQRPSLPRL